MKILVTGAAGFIGYHTVKKLLEEGHIVTGLDNINSYYDVELKYARLYQTGIEKQEIHKNKIIKSKTYNLYQFIATDLIDKEALFSLFEKEKFTHIIHLAAQAGVRYSLQNPYAYIDSNIIGFTNILEACKQFKIEHLIYASSSSVYGANSSTPFKESDRTDSPVSFYAATKKANELIAYSYANLYKIRLTGVRLFTVYGPWGRPDMAPYLFMSAIIKDKPFQVFNHGEMKRDFTYIDDVVNGLMKIIQSPSINEDLHSIYNLGNSKPIKLMDFISEIEIASQKKAHIEYTDMQPGDVVSTYADITMFMKHFHFKPSVSIKTGIDKYYNWYKDYYQIK